MNETNPAFNAKKVNPKENLPIFKKIDSEEFSELYDTKKLYLGCWKHLILIFISAGVFSILGFWGIHKFTNTYQAEAVVIFHEHDEAPKALEGAFNLTNFTIATVLDVIKTPKHLEAVKTR